MAATQKPNQEQGIDETEQSLEVVNQFTVGAATCKHGVEAGIDELEESSEARRQMTVADELILGQSSCLVMDQSDFG